MEWRSPSAAQPTAEELRAYVGPNADRYLVRFARFRRGDEPRFAFSWNWMALGVGVWWYLYRKMYLWAVVDFALSVLFGWTLFVPLLWAMARAVTADYLYLRQAERAVLDSRSFSAGAADPAHLARVAAAGGVHRWIPWAAAIGTIVLALLSSLVFLLVWKMLPPLREIWPALPGHWA
jgi:hypothetical protein